MTPGQTTMSFLPLAERFREVNPVAYQAGVQWALDDVEQGVRPSIDLIANLWRRPHIAKHLGLKSVDGRVLVNNNTRSELARLMASEHPVLKDPKRGFDMRKSASDPATGPRR